MKTYRIGELSGSAWENAIVNVGRVLGRQEKEAKNSWVFVEGVASKLGVRFDINGYIVSE